MQTKTKPKETKKVPNDFRPFFSLPELAKFLVWCQ